MWAAGPRPRKARSVYPGPLSLAMNRSTNSASRRGGRPVIRPLLALLPLLFPGLGLVAGCSGGGGSSSPKAGQVTVPGTATVLPGVCASGPGPVPGAICMTLTIESLANPVATLELRVVDPAAGVPLLGTVILGSGGLGAEFLTDSPGGLELSNALLAAGFRIVDRRWEAGWIQGQTNVLHQSARFAVLADWVRSNLHTTGAMCVFGNSGGAAEIAYSLTSWEGDDLFDVAVMASGPPLTRLDYLCETPASAAWAAQCASLVAPGLLACGQPTCEPEPTNPLCPLLPANPLPGQLLAESILRPGADLDYPTTVVQVLLGAQDCTSAVPLALLYLNAVTSPIGLGIVPNTPHELFSTQEGRDAILVALTTGLGIPDAGATRTGPHTRVHLTWIELGTSR